MKLDKVIPVSHYDGLDYNGVLSLVRETMFDGLESRTKTPTPSFTVPTFYLLLNYAAIPLAMYLFYRQTSFMLSLVW